MSFGLKSIKKLIHVQKACRSFTEIFRSKLHVTKARKAIKKVTNFLVSSRQNLRFRQMRQQRYSMSHHYFLLERGSPVIFYGKSHGQKFGQPLREPTTVKFKEPVVGTKSTSTGSGGHLENTVAIKHGPSLCERKKVGNMRKFNRDWLHARDIRGIDERADDFISKVREDMKLQREQSILDFQEMLARSV